MSGNTKFTEMSSVQELMFAVWVQEQNLVQEITWKENAECRHHTQKKQTTKKIQGDLHGCTLCLHPRIYKDENASLSSYKPQLTFFFIPLPHASLTSFLSRDTPLTNLKIKTQYRSTDIQLRGMLACPTIKQRLLWWLLGWVGEGGVFHWA